MLNVGDLLWMQTVVGSSREGEHRLQKSFSSKNCSVFIQKSVKTTLFFLAWYLSYLINSDEKHHCKSTHGHSNTL